MKRNVSSWTRTVLAQRNRLLCQHKCHLQLHQHQLHQYPRQQLLIQCFLHHSRPALRFLSSNSNQAERHFRHLALPWCHSLVLEWRIRSRAAPYYLSRFRRTCCRWGSDCVGCRRELLTHLVHTVGSFESDSICTRIN